MDPTHSVPAQAAPGEGTTAPDSAAARTVERVQEDPPTYGEARLGGVTLHVEPTTRMQVALPRDYVTSWGEDDRVPFVLDIGSPGVALHMNRPELERLYALIGRALDAAEQRGDQR
jgi:hypothetical protein